MNGKNELPNAVCYTDPLGGVESLTSDNTPHLTPNQTPSSKVHHPLDTVNDKMHKIWSVDSEENYYNCCHQMSYFKAKMHQIVFRLGLRPRPRWGAYSAPPDPLAGF